MPAYQNDKREILRAKSSEKGINKDESMIRPLFRGILQNRIFLKRAVEDL
jgi:hypothetical protein